MRLLWTIAGRLSSSLRADGFARFTSVVSTAAIALGTLALLLSISILTGYEERILQTATQFTAHIELRSTLTGGFNLTAEQITSIQQLDGVQRAEPILVCEALARTRVGIDGVIVQGMDRSRLSTSYAQSLTSGTMPSGSECVVGSELARRLGLAVADTLLLYAANTNNTTPVVFTSKISGIVASGMQTVDGSLVAMDIRSLSKSLEQAGNPSMMAITLDDPERAPRIAVKLLTMLPNDIAIVTWKDRFANVSNWIDLQKEPIPVVLGLISIVAGFTLISTLLTSIVLKTRSLTIFLSLGLSPKRIAGVVLIRAIRLGFVGSMLGAAIAYILVWIQHEFTPIALDGAIYYVSSLPVSLNLEPFILMPLLGIGLAIIAATIPMLVVVRLPVANALRWG